MKTTTKRMLAICMVFVTILSLAACGSQKNSSGKLVGQWYNLNGRCLDIRSDGSWKLDGDYGTGTWKKLDNGNYEFMDFYGETRESCVHIDEHGEYLDLGSWGEYYLGGYSSSAQNDNDTLEPEESDFERYPIDKIVTRGTEYLIGDGHAWVQYTSGDYLVYALVDTNGNQKYAICFEDRDVPSVYAPKAGICYYRTPAKDYFLLNTAGELIGSSQNGDFDSILAYGDGMALVYKFEGGLSSAEHLYGVIDKNGKWVMEYTDLRVDPTDIDAENIVYLNSDVFAIGIEEGWGFGNYIVFINANTGKVFSLIKDKLYKSSVGAFCNGYNYISLDDVLLKSDALNDVADAIEISDKGFLKNDGTYQSFEDVYPHPQRRTYISDSFIISKSEKEYELFDYVTKETYNVKRYNTSDNVSFRGDYGYMSIVGADGEDYFTILNRDGTARFEPIRGDILSYFEGYVVFKIDSLSYLCDQDGKIMLDGNGYYKIDYLGENIVVYQADYDDVKTAIDFEGSPVFTVVIAEADEY